MSRAVAMGGHNLGFTSVRLRLSSLLVALVLLCAPVVILQQRAEAAPARASVSAVVAVPGPTVSAQIGFGSFVCPILVTLRNAFAQSPFFSFISPILNALIASFGCGPS